MQDQAQKQPKAEVRKVGMDSSIEIEIGKLRHQGRDNSDHHFGRGEPVDKERR